MSTQAIPEPAKKLINAEDVFRITIIAVTVVLSLCVKGILEFRQFCQQNGYYVFAAESMAYCLIGFFMAWGVKYSFFYLMLDKVEAILLPKYEGEMREIKTKAVAKLFYDTLFYISTTVSAYIVFHDQPWFPSLIGGAGQCSNLYDSYPDWPTNKRTELEVYFTLQLGVHIFSVFELAVIKRKTDRKFYENLLHHFVAASLILSSMACNEIRPGVVILIVHDWSDIMLAFTRAYLETVLPKKAYLMFPMGASTLLGWIYMRLIVFPCCLLLNVFNNQPTEQDSWNIVYNAYMYLLVMAIILFGMHIYWTFYLIKSALKSLCVKDIINEHDKLVKEK